MRAGHDSRAALVSQRTAEAATRESRAAKESNKLRHEDRSVHDWYRFVLSYPPHLVREYLTRFELPEKATVLDPFCGTGTTLVECKKIGVSSVGLEPHPMSWFASRTKVKWEVDADELWRNAQTVAERATERLQKEGIDDFMGLPLVKSTRGGGLALRCLTEDQSRLLLKNSISPLPLHKTLVLLETLAELSEPEFAAHQRLALANALVNRIGNLHFGPEVGVTAPKLDAPVIPAWLDVVESMANDIRVVDTGAGTQSAAIRADARDVDSVLGEASVDAVITSPPYPNEKDYTRTTRLESVLLGFIRTRAELRAFKQDLVRSNTRNVYKADEDDLHMESFPRINSIAARIEQRRVELGKTSGFEKLYPRVTRLYFGGMYRHLRGLRRVLKPGARLAYVVGDQASYLRIMIRTGQLLGEIAESLGYEVMGLDLFRTRRATATRSELREEVLLLRWPEERHRTGGGQ